MIQLFYLLKIKNRFLNVKYHSKKIIVNSIIIFTITLKGVKSTKIISINE